MAAPTIPTKNTGDTLSAAEINNLATSVTALYGSTIWRFNITQTGTGDPTITTLENNTGITVVGFTRSSAGNYVLEMSQQPVSAKVFVQISNSTAVGGGITNAIYDNGLGGGYLTVLTNNGNTPNDNLLKKTSVELRIYP